MPAYNSYKFVDKVTEPSRPIGVAILAILGVLGSLATILVALVELLTMMRVSAHPSIQLAVLGAALVLALVILWINWGLWELIRWAWWSNLALTLITIAILIATLRYIQPLSSALSRLRPELTLQQLASGVSIAIVATLAYHLIVVIYLLSVRAVFGVGIKDERPLWKRAQRR